MEDIQYLSFTNKATAISRRLNSNAEVMANGKSHNALALWDTGATGSCISENVVNSLGLIPTGRQTIKTPSGEKDVNTYLISIGLPNHVLVPDILVCDSDIGSQGIDLLIGMDIISLGDFAVTNRDAKTTFSFRTPSKKTIDFVLEWNLEQKIKPHGPGKRKKSKK